MALSIIIAFLLLHRKTLSLFCVVKPVATEDSSEWHGFLSNAVDMLYTWCLEYIIIRSYSQTVLAFSEIYIEGHAHLSCCKAKLASTEVLGTFT